ncbi:hypothetical protein ACFFQF_12890 [Haladaptatus pallidirubidus]|uniref:Uncharacterized protein n=1 Tax=Haladaptatus pallidirubidus TaxID=1008152 RepID=A0AAV3UDS0_9EURY|nr:hypothetical protein [Haladaptatus pallidirubidus]
MDILIRSFCFFDIAARVAGDIEPLDWSLVVQCPACESTDVAVEPSALLARVHGSTTES